MVKKKCETVNLLQKNLNELKKELQRYKETSHNEFTALSEHSKIKANELKRINTEHQELDAAFKCFLYFINSIKV